MALNYCVNHIFFIICADFIVKSYQYFSNE